MNKAIIIPIYLRLDQPEAFAHSEGLRLAKRAIESLKILNHQDFTLILPVCLDLTWGNGENSLIEMDRLVRRELEGAGLQRTVIFSSRRLQRLREYLAKGNFRNFLSLIDLKGFSKIRNTGLLLAQALSMDAVVFIDNDEIVEDPDYLETASEYLNQRWSGRLVSGKGGFYVNPDGSILLPPRGLWWNLLWNKTKWMNRVWEKILSSRDRLVSSPMLLGGNLVLHRRLFQNVPFDPYIPRGEDTDYLINASQLGFCLLFDRQLRIKHLPPERTENFYQEELKGDIERFLYERKKTRAEFHMNLDPYPGYFLKWTLYPKAVLTSIFLSLDYLQRKEWRKARECISNLNLIFQKGSEGWMNYLRFRRDWERVMAEIRIQGMDEVLRDG